MQGEGYSSLAFNSAGDPVVAVVEQPERGAPATLSTFSINASGGVVETPIADNLSAPRYAAIAIGPDGETAIYVGAEPHSEVLFKKGDKLERTPLPEKTNLPGPLAFEANGRLHHVYVVSTTVDRREARSLVHRWREPNGEWHDSLVASTQSGPMSAHICLALVPHGLPVVVSDWAGEGVSRSLVCHEMASVGKWQTKMIDLVPFLSEFGLPGISSSELKQIVVDRCGIKHIVLYSDMGGSRNVLYLAVDREFRSIERRVFPANSLIGLSVDGRGDVYVATL